MRRITVQGCFKVYGDCMVVKVKEFKEARRINSKRTCDSLDGAKCPVF